MVTVLISQINWCAFCVDINSALALKRGFSKEQLAALSDFENSPLFDARSKAALAYAQTVTRTDGRVDAALMARLKSEFDDEAIIELTALIAFQNLSSKFNSALDVAAQGFCAVAPLPGATAGAPEPRAGGRAD
jgi:AhpD family alkylhydroperoxidase